MAQCDTQKANCIQTYKVQFRQAKAACQEQSTAAARQYCIDTAKRAKSQRLADCKYLAKADCKPCCAGEDVSGCAVKLCGDGQQVPGEECEPPNSDTCDAECRVLIPPTTTTVAPPTTTTTQVVVTTTTAGPTTTTTTLPGGGAGVTVQLSAPANGTHYVVGESPVVYVILNDDDGNPMARADFGTLNLYMHGPKDQALTTTSSALLRASTDRNASVHHYINLKTNADVVAVDNVLMYPLSAVTDELPGTYTVSVWATNKTDGKVQWMPMADCQIGTAVVEDDIVTADKCGSCHFGADAGKYYMHHIDPGFSPTGNWALDSAPVTNCKACHNQDGYAGYNNGAGGSDRNVNRTTDPIVRRVHGVHMGEELQLPFNNDPEDGDFADYIHVAFPADVRNCTSCHVDDRWRNNPSAGACGTCHDAVWFGAVEAMPADYTAHPGGPHPDNECFVCHAAGQLWDTADAHAIPAPTALDNVTRKALNQVDVSLTPPGNGTHYVAGEAPVVTIVIRDDGGNPIDHTKVTSGNFGAAALFVYGNRAAGLPVLTNTARYGVSKLRASATSGSASNWTFVDGDTFKIAINGNAMQELTAPTGTKTPAQVKTWLEGELSGVTITSTSTAVTIKSNIQGPSSLIAIYDSAVTTKMVWKAVGTTVDPDIRAASASYPQNDLRSLSDVLDYADPAVTRNVGNITYQLDDVDGLEPGTYSVYVWSRPTKDKVTNLTQIGYGYLEFQVGTATAEKKVATNCTNCHGDNIMHIPTPTERGPHPAAFDADQCKACHDYSHYNVGADFKNQGGTSQNGWSGFGAGPISRRVHGLHFGRYLEHPEQIYSGGNPFPELIFPQDIRNCSSCHPAGETTDAWLEQPNRLACLGCHDSDAAKTHAQLMTYIPDPDDPYGAGSVESCEVCHGKGKTYAPDVVHALVPYQPPYPRDPE